MSQRDLVPARLLLLAALLGMPGCVRLPGAADTLTIATSWQESDRARLEAGFRRWLERQPTRNSADPLSRIAWMTVESDDDLVRLARPSRRSWDPRPRSADVFLGGHASAYRRLTKDRLLDTSKNHDTPGWLVVRRDPIGWAVRADVADQPAAATHRRTFDDPRRDAVAREWAKGELAAGEWAAGYARLVHHAAGPRPIGRRAGSAMAAVERGEADACPATASSVRRPLVMAPGRPTAVWVEGVAVASGSGNPRLAREFLAFLQDAGAVEVPQDAPAEADEADSVIADLLGATLVDAQDELGAAWRALDRVGHPARLESWMTQAPPWPPASVLKLGERDGSGVLLQALVEQIAPDPAVRAWLLQSWLAAERPIDGAVLDELVHAAEGRLVREPRFREWLRAEWTAWARQRYRRVARQAGGGPT